MENSQLINLFVQKKNKKKGKTNRHYAIFRINYLTVCKYLQILVTLIKFVIVNKLNVKLFKNDF